MLQHTASLPFRNARHPSPCGFTGIEGLGLTLEVYDRLDGLAPLWHEISASAPPSLFQSHPWLEAWAQTAAPAQGEYPLVAVFRGTDGQLRLLLPLGVRRVLGVTVAQFLAQAHANYNVALMERGFQETACPADISALLGSLAEARAIAAFHFDKQPERWNGLPNPFAGWWAQACANDSYVLALDRDFETIAARLFSKRTRSMLRRKARKLASGGEVAFTTVTGADARRRLLGDFFAYKGRQLAEQGAGNIFAQPGVADFYEGLLDLPVSVSGRLEVRTLDVGDSAVAIALTAAHAGRRYLLNMALAPHAPRDCSPGALLLHHDIEQACRDGCVAYDFGPGAAAYKTAWQPDTLPLKTSTAAMSPAGLPAAAMLASAALAKRLIKRSPTAWSLTTGLRRRMRGHPDVAQAACEE